MPNIEVIATDGELQSRILWISITTNGIYCNLVHEGQGRHYTLHKDGSLWVNFNELKYKDNQFEPLDQLKRRLEFVTFDFVPDIKQIVTPDYTMKKLDSVIFVDTRAYNEPTRTYITCSVNLIEPRNYKQLEGIEKFGGEIHVYTQFKLGPWIVISIH